MIDWIIKNFKISVMLFTMVFLPIITGIASFSWGFYKNVVNSTETNMRQDKDISEIKQGFNSQKSDIDIMKGNMSSIKEDTSAIKAYFMKRAVEK